MIENIIDYEIKPLRTKFYILSVIMILIYIISFIIFFGYSLISYIEPSLILLSVFFTIFTTLEIFDNINKIFSNKIKKTIFKIISNNSIKLRKIDKYYQGILSTQIEKYKQYFVNTEITVKNKEIIEFNYNNTKTYIFIVQVSKKTMGVFHLIILNPKELNIKEFKNDINVLNIDQNDQYHILETSKKLDINMWSSKLEIREVIKNIEQIINFLIDSKS